MRIHTIQKQAAIAQPYKLTYNMIINGAQLPLYLAYCDKTHDVNF